MNAMGRWWLATGMTLTATLSQANVMNRLYVADMSDFGKNLGFVVDFENDAPDGHVCPLDSLRLVLGVGDGKSVRYAITTSKFQLGQTIQFSARLSSTDAVLRAGDETLHAGIGFRRANTSVKAGTVPSWANAASAYRLVEQSLSVTVGSSTHTFEFSGSKLSPVLALFENSLPLVKSIPVADGQGIDIEGAVRIEPLAGLSHYKPVIDRFGQVIQARFPGKIVSEQQLSAAYRADDQRMASWKSRIGVDKFGGELHVSWANRGTGFYRTVKRNGYWWLVSPLGNPLFYTGVCTAPSVTWDSTPVTDRKDLFQQLPPTTGIEPSMWTQNVWGTSGTEYATVHGLNLLRRFGAKEYFAKANDECRRRLAAWGFSGQGKWCDALPQTPYLPVIDCPTVPKLDRHIDAFDPQIRAKLKAALASQLAKDKNNPFILGYSYGNEYDQIVTPEEVQHILGSKTASAAKVAMIEYATARLYAGSEAQLRAAWKLTAGKPLSDEVITPAGSDVEKLRQFYEAKYYATLYDAFKSADANHLFFGCWTVPGWWVNDTDWNLIAQHVDVIGFDRYADWPGIENLLTRYDKPVLLGEFSFPSWYGGARGFGRYSIYTESDAESGQRYAALLAGASKCPQCVGTMWFQYRDEPITGRGPAVANSVAEGEHYAFGLVDACDLPKLDLVVPVRLANLAANSDRLKATK